MNLKGWGKFLRITLALYLMVHILGDMYYLFLYNYDKDNSYALKKNIEQAINSGIKQVKINDITNFEWDHVCVYAPYMWHGKADAWSLVFDKKGNIILEVEMSEYVFGVLSYENLCITKKVCGSRNSEPLLNLCATKNNATFMFSKEIEEDKSGRKLTKRYITLTNGE